MDLTHGNGASDPISVPVGDPIGGPNDTPLAFNRSQTDPATGTGPGNPAQDVNSVSSYFDLSQIYGSDQATDNALRTFVGGQMKTSPGGLPPLDNSTYFTAAQLAAINASVGGMADDGPLPESQMFVTGDSRGNENVELTVLQTLFLDNHNRLASELQKENPTWTDQQLFDEARKLNIAQYQSIIYNEWIPAVLGPNALPAYTGYNSNVNASIANEFSTVAFRFGHSLLSGDVERQGNNGQAVAADVPLAEDFFDPNILNGEGQPSTTDPSDRADDHQHRRSPEGRCRRGRPGRGRGGHQRSPQRALQRGRAGRGLRPGPDRPGHSEGPRQRHRIVQRGPGVAGTAGRDQLRADHQQRPGPEGAASGLRQRQQHRRHRRGHGRGPRRRIRRRPLVPGDHGQPVHATQGRRPLLLPQRDVQPERAGALPAGQHAGQGHRGQHRTSPTCKATSSSSRRRSAERSPSTSALSEGWACPASPSN